MNLPQLAKATIINTETAEQVAVMYNPEQFTLDQGNDFAEIGIPGLNAPPIQYVRGKGRTLSMELFFDSYERAVDVRQFTDGITRLLDKLPGTHAPPVLLFAMGQFIFRCVLVDAAQRFSMFLADGTPVRSTLNVRFHEYVDAQVTIERGVFIGPPTLHNVVQGQTVSGIATQIYGDPSRWRGIARANGIEDPFHPVTGQRLVVPGTTHT
jgi:nucleoid-associated protein YgaU